MLSKMLSSLMSRRIRAVISEIIDPLKKNCTTENACCYMNAVVGKAAEAARLP